MSQTNEPTTHAETARVREVLPDETLTSNILIVGPTLSEKDTLAFDLLAESWTPDRLPFVITANDTARQFRSRFEPLTPPDRDIEDVYVIDCTESNGTDVVSDPPTCASATPADLTGVGICLAKGYDRFGTPGGRMVLLDNLSTFLVYSDVDRIFRFVSSMTNRVTELGDSSVHLLDTDAISTADRNTLLQLFSILIEVREQEGTTFFRVRGDAGSDWYEYLPSRGESR